MRIEIEEEEEEEKDARGGARGDGERGSVES